MSRALMQVRFRPAPAAFLAGLLVVLCACTGGPRRDEARETQDQQAPPARSASPGGPEMVNKDFSIVRMSTAHGAFVIELETDHPERTGELSRLLIEPIKSQYVEILVYATRTGGDKPARRVVWTPKDGYVELDYEGK